MTLENNLGTETTWDIHETDFYPEHAVTTGTTFMFGNGYLGYRGTFSDDRAADFVACVVSDTYDNADGVWKELVTAPNGLFTELGVDGMPLRWRSGGWTRYERRIDVRYGVWTVAADWPERGVAIREERRADFSDLHLLVSRKTITATRDVELSITSGIDVGVWSLNGEHFSSQEAGDNDGDLEVVGVTSECGYDVVVRQRSYLEHNGSAVVMEPTQRGELVLAAHTRTTRIALRAGDEVTLTHYVGIYSTNDLRTGSNPHTAVTVPGAPRAVGAIDPAATAAQARRSSAAPADPDRPSQAAVRAAARATVDAAVAIGWDASLARHKSVWDKRWETMDIRIEGDDAAQALIRYNLFHNIIATPAHADHLPIGARGLSSQAYQGAAFWDQEIFNLPMFLFTDPVVSRNLLVYRYRTLDGARRKARDLGYLGAFYAWISGDSGEEICPAYFFKDTVSGRAIRNHFNDWQIHVSPDIAYTVRRYVEATGDIEFLHLYGAEMVFEVARFLYSRALLRQDRNRYELIRVLGPDEYHENVDNNFFTAVQARDAARYAVEVFDLLSASAPEVLGAVSTRISLAPHERDQWADLAERLYVAAPDPQTRLIEQFDGYFELEDARPDQIRERLIDPGEYWGWPNGIAVPTQVIKQADVVQAFALHPTQWDPEIMRANWDYYEPRTQHGSSLSPAVYAMVAAWIGRDEAALRYFFKSCTIDLYNDSKAVSGGTFIGGIHTAACGVNWQVVVFGFGGMYLTATGLGFRPHLPAPWQRISWSVVRWGVRLSVMLERGTLAEGGVRVTVESNSTNRTSLTVELGMHQAEVSPGQTCTLTPS